MLRSKKHLFNLARYDKNQLATERISINCDESREMVGHHDQDVRDMGPFLAAQRIFQSLQEKKEISSAEDESARASWEPSVLKTSERE